MRELLLAVSLALAACATPAPAVRQPSFAISRSLPANVSRADFLRAAREAMAAAGYRGITTLNDDAGPCSLLGDLTGADGYAVPIAVFVCEGGYQIHYVSHHALPSFTQRGTAVHQQLRRWILSLDAAIAASLASR